jgi:hypothetical protein
LAPVAAQADPTQRALTSIGAGTSVSETEKSVWDQSFYAFTVRVNGVERDFWVADITRSASTSVSQSSLTGVVSQTSNSSGPGADGSAGVQNGSLILGANNSASVSASQRSIVISNGFEPIFASGGSMYPDRDSLLDPTPWDKRWWGNDRTPYDSNEAAEKLAQASSTTLTINNPGDNTTVDLGDYDLVIPAVGGPHLVDNKARKAAEKLAKITPEVIAKQAAALTRVSGSDEIKLSRENLALSLFTHASNRYLGIAENSQGDKTGTSADSTISPSFAGSGVVAGPVPASKTVLPDNVAAVLAPISVTVVA